MKDRYKLESWLNSQIEVMSDADLLKLAFERLLKETIIIVNEARKERK